MALSSNDDKIWAKMPYPFFKHPMKLELGIDDHHNN